MSIQPTFSQGVGHCFPVVPSDAPVDTEFKVLDVEGMSNDFGMLTRLLRRARLCNLTWERPTKYGLTELATNQYDVTLLDLTLPDTPRFVSDAG